MRFIKKHYVNFLSFIIPITIFLIANTLNNNFPIGEYTLSIYDGSLQHPGFLEIFKDSLLGNSSIFYSFSGALGYNFFATFIYYLASPLNLFSIFFKTEYYVIFYSILSYIKIGLCGLTMSILLNYFNKNKKCNIIFSCCYALMAYNIVYYSNYMWIDSVIMCPLVILGIEKLINDNKKVFYLVSLTLSILFNFYIGYMICIFSVIYFIYKHLSNNVKNNNIIKDFTILSILSGLISSIFLIPVAFELFNGKTDLYNNSIQTNYFSFSLDFFNSFYRLSIGAFNNADISYGEPNIYSSIFVVTLVLLFFFNKKIEFKEKIIVLSIISFYLLCFSFNLFDYAWHFFQRPIWFPNRYTFTFSIFLILIAYKSFTNLNGISLNKKLFITYICLILIIIASAIFNDIYKEPIRIISLLFSIMLLFLYISLFIVKPKKTYMLLFVFIFLELTINTFFTLKNLSYNNTVEYKISEAQSIKTDLSYIKDNEFYRLELNNDAIHNNGALFNYNGINYFNSLRNGNVMNFLENKLGVKVIDDCRISYNSYNILFNSLFGVKYFDGTSDEYYFKSIYDKNRIIYENDLTLPLIFTGNNKNIELKNKDYFNNYEKIFNSYINDNIDFINNDFKIQLKNVKVKNNKYTKTNDENEIKYSIKTYKAGWIMFNNKEIVNNLNPTILINEKNINYNTSKYTPVYINKNDYIEIKYQIKNEKINKNDLDLYFINYEEFKSIIDKINLNKVNYKVIKDNKIEFNTNYKNKKTILTTIPYEKGWQIYVDGKRINKNKNLDTFLSFEIDSGKHDIKLVYIPSGLIIGSIISLLSIIGSIVYIKKTKVNNS